MGTTNLWRRVVAFAALVVLVAGVAVAQLQTGNLYGSVSDDQGSPLPGVSIAIAGTGAQSQVTDEQGRFRFIGLSPGSYDLTAELEGFGPISYPNIGINIGRNTEISVTMNAAVTDVITVTTESPLLDKSRIAVQTTVAQTELEKIPTARDPWAVLSSTPGVLTDRINVGGNESGQQSQYQGPGSGGDQAVWSVDGVVITDMAALGSSPAYYDFDSFEEMQVTTGGSDASTATGGVVLNMVTKRGTNEFRGSARYIFGCGTDANGDTKGDQCFTNMQGDLDISTSEFAKAGPWNNVTTGRQAAFSQGNKIQSVEDYGFEVGGPIIKDRFWFWGSLGRNDIDLLTVLNVRDHTILDTQNVKLNAQVAAPNSLTLFALQSDKVKIGRNAGPSRPQKTTWNQSKFGDDPTTWKIEDTHVFSSNFYLSGMYSIVNGGFQLVPQGEQNVFAFFDFVSWQNTFLLYQSERPQEQIKVDGSTFFATGSASHEMKFGISDRSTESNSVTQWGLGQALDLTIFGLPGLTQINAFRESGAAVELTTQAAYVQDTISFGNLTANIGFNYSKQGGTLLAKSVPASTLVPTLLPAVNVPGKDIGFEWSDISPRLGLTYALGAERKTLLRGSYARFADQLGSGLAVQTSPLYNYSYAYFYTYANVRNGVVRVSDLLDLNGNGVIDGGDATFVGVNPATGQPVVSTAIDPNFSAPQTDELLFSVEHALRPEFVVGLNLTYRQITDITENDRLVFDTNPQSPANITQLGRRATAADYVPITFTGTLPDGSTYTGTRYALKPSVATRGGVFWYNGGAEQEYKGASVTFNKRLSNRWMMRGNFSFSDWTWSKVPADSLEDPTPGRTGGVRAGDPVVNRVAGSGKSGGRYINSKWAYTLNGLYQVAPDRPWGFNVAGNITGRQGYPTPYQRNFRLGGNQNGATQIVLLPEEATDFRLDDVQTVDLRIEKEFNVRDLGITVGADLFNALNESTVLFRNPTLNVANGDHVQEVLSPRIFRLGVRLSLR